MATTYTPSGKAWNLDEIKGGMIRDSGRLMRYYASLLKLPFTLDLNVS